MIWIWLRGLLTNRPGRSLGSMIGVALTVALLASLDAFVGSAARTMTTQATASVPVDWQVQLLPGTDPQTVRDALAKATATRAIEEVGYADTQGLVARTGDTVQTTGPGQVVGLGPSYRDTFPGQTRLLLGAWDGVLIAQQTATNLQVTVGDTVTVRRVGVSSVDLPVAGVVALPNADSMFQAVGLPKGAQPQAPPDNVLLLPLRAWHRLFDPQAEARPDSVRLQLHIGLAHAGLPSDPQAAYTQVQGAARNLEARLAGRAVVADNLAARLDATRADALYARVLFLFLGLPGAILAALFTQGLAATGASRRGREQALLRTRGASVRQLGLLAGVEALAVAVAGVALGLLLAALTVWLLALGSLFQPSSVLWTAAAAIIGLLLALATILLPAWHQARRTAVVAARAVAGEATAPIWERFYLDLVCLAVAAGVFWQTWRTGYQVVLAPEGVAAAAVHYDVFIAPLLLWIGAGLLTMRLARLGLGRGRARLAQALRPLVGALAATVAAALSRQRRRLTQGIVLVALAFAFGTSTAIFNTTYNAQAKIDAELTNGADVTVTGTSAAPAGSRLAPLRAIPGVFAAEPMMHRYAYVGTDLQDMYGIDATGIGRATAMSNAYFGNGNAAASLRTLQTHADGVLVSEETVRDFQLQPGDLLNLRLQGGPDQQYHVVPFHFVGVVREFPTAPKDSFLVANASYVAQQTALGAHEIVLIRTVARPASVAAQARQVVATLPGAEVSAIENVEQLIGSSLTAVDLRGLTRIELVFAVLMAAGIAGLILGLGLVEQRRSMAILWAVGAKPRQLASFLWSEGLLIIVSGMIAGTVTGLAIAQVLVKVLTGVFDPPPEALSVPWLYLVLLVGVGLAAALVALFGVKRSLRQPPLAMLREL